MCKTLSQELSARKLPELLSRETMLHILQDQEYGFLPPPPTELTFETKDNVIPRFCAGKADLKAVTATCKINGASFSFPFNAVIPTGPGKYPFFIHINFRDCVPDRYMPTEELVDNGFAVLSFCYQDVTTDDGDFTNGLAGVLYPDGKRGNTDAGKIAMWAWAAQRLMDYACTLPEVLDLDRAVVCGHSRLGKTALFAAATDPRFRFAYSNDSGCSGAAITRDKQGERVAFITKTFPFWFCENYKSYAEKEAQMPFDQHYLLACIAPRFVCVGSAQEDLWADPESEMLSCLAAAPAFGDNGFVCEDRFAQPGECFYQGPIGYHMRSGLHCFSREDWNNLIRFINLHSGKSAQDI